jgi:DNA processing protein
MAVPGPVTSAMSVGAHQLVRERNARVVTSTAEVVEEVGLIGTDLAARPCAPQSWRDILGHAAEAAVDALGRALMSAEEIAAEAGIAVADVERVLPGLVGCGLAVQRDGRYRAAEGIRAAGDAAPRTVLPSVR